MYGTSGIQKGYGVQDLLIPGLRERIRQILDIMEEEAK
jgi:hypothetical protein